MKGSMNGILFRTMAFSVFIILNSSFFIHNCEAQTTGKYDFYRYLQKYAIEIDPIEEVLGRISAQFEERLDPNFSRSYEIVYQRKLENRSNNGWYPESGITVGALDRIYLIDNSSLLGGYIGLGFGVGRVNETIAVRATAEMGYKICLGGGTGHYFIEPRLMMDAYIITNHDSQRILPYISLPFGYSWW